MDFKNRLSFFITNDLSYRTELPSSVYQKNELKKLLKSGDRPVWIEWEYIDTSLDVSEKIQVFLKKLNEELSNAQGSLRIEPRQLGLSFTDDNTYFLEGLHGNIILEYNALKEEVKDKNLPGMIMAQFTVNPKTSSINILNGVGDAISFFSGLGKLALARMFK